MNTIEYNDGFDTAAREIAAGAATSTQARERGLFISQSDRVEWDRGYADAVCAHRLGHNLDDMIGADMRGPSILEMHAIIDEIASGKRSIRPDPRQR